MICYYLTFISTGTSTGATTGTAAELSTADRDRLTAMLKAVPGLTKSLIFTPASARDPYLDDGACPPLMLECYFPTVEALEAAIADGGAFQRLGDADFLPSLGGAAITQQAMIARPFPVPDPVFRIAAGEAYCTYVVSYEGTAADPNAWLSYYIAHHPLIMARFPGIREIEISTRIDWCSGLPWARQDCLQRNKTVFDSAVALDAALNSPVRHEMREDFHRFPPFAGRNTHYPMATRCVLP